MTVLLEHDTTRRIIGVFYDVYNELGHGFLESVYQEALVRALDSAGLRVDREVPLEVHFRDDTIGHFRADLIVERRVIIEVKTAAFLTADHWTQLTNYLRATDIEVGLLLNFGPKPQFRRAVCTNDRS